MAIKLKNSMYLLKESEDVYQAIFTSTRKILRFQANNLVKSVIEELKYETTEYALVEKLKNVYDKRDITSCINSLEKYGLLRRYNKESINEKYSRQISFIDELTESWDETIKLQKKIENSTVSVFGVGGIGTWVVNGLSQIGVGNIRIIDPDKVSLSNLNRQLFFNEEDIGKYKVDVIKAKIYGTKIFVFKEFVSSRTDLENIVLGSDFLVNCADLPSVAETTEIIDKYARKYNIPYCVAGGYNMHLGMVGLIIIPGVTASFQDFLEYQKKNDPLSGLLKVKDIEQTGSLGPIAGAVANIQVMEIFKFLIGKGRLNINRFAEINFMDFSIEWREWKKGL